MPVQIQLRHDTAANWTSADPTLALGEVGIETDTNLFKFGDGATAWTGLSYAIAGSFTNPMTTAGDLIVGDTGGAPIRLPKGSDGQVLTVNASTHLLDWETPGSGSSPLTTKGDLWGFSTVDARVPVGTDGDVLTADSGAALGVSYQTPGGGGGSSRPYIDTISLDGTYGDDFTGASLDAKWTARNQASETFQDGGGTWMTYDITNAAADRGQFFQVDGGGDMEIILSFTRLVDIGSTMFGPMFIDSSGNGVGVGFYDNSNSCFSYSISAYGYNSLQTSFPLLAAIGLVGVKVWIGLRVVGTTYDFRFSQNGYIWSPYKGGYNNGFTRDRLGFGRVLGTPTTDRISVDRFNKV